MIAVIIPTKDCPYLKESLASFIPNYTNFYIRVMDDNSENWEVNRDTCKKFSKLLNIHYHRLIDSTTPGQCLYPIKEGIKRSKDADYIKIFGSDDFLEPHALDYEHEFIDRHKDKFDAVLTSYTEVNDSLQPLNRVYKVHHTITKDMMKLGCFMTDATVVKRSFFDDVAWDTTIGSRWLWRIWFEMMCKGLRVYSIPDFISQKYRKHTNNMSNKDGYRVGEAKLPCIFKEIEEKYAVSDNRNNR